MTVLSRREPVAQADPAVYIAAPVGYFVLPRFD
jgi:hypothetical protein